MKYLLKFLLALSLFFSSAFAENSDPGSSIGARIMGDDCTDVSLFGCYFSNNEVVEGLVSPIVVAVDAGFTNTFINVTAAGLDVDGKGTAILDWNVPSDTLHFDAVYLGVNVTVKVADGKAFYADSVVYKGILSNTQIKSLAGKTLFPISGVDVLMDTENHLSVSLDGENSTSVLISRPIVAYSVTFNREFRVGKASTIMLPFSTTQEMDVKGGDFIEFNGVVRDADGAWVALMREVPSKIIEANKPYLFIPSASTLEFDLNGGTVTLVPTVASGVVKDGWTFKGVYDYKMWEAADAELGNAYGFAAAEKGDASVGDFVKVAAGAYIYPMRAYMLYNPAESPAAGEEPVLARRAGSAAKVLDAANLPDVIEVRLSVSGGETTSIGKLYTKTGEFKMDRWFSVDGRKLNAKPATKGTYFNNGQKVIVK